MSWKFLNIFIFYPIDRKQRVAKQMGEINKLKANIVRVKNQLQNVFDNNK